MGFLEFERIWTRFYDPEQRVFNEILSNLQPENKEILDVGCGVGRFSVRLAENAKKIYALDKNKEHLDLLKSREEYKYNIKLINGDACSIPLKDNSVDGVLCSFCFFMLDKEKALKEILRVCREDSPILLLEPSLAKHSEFDGVGTLILKDKARFTNYKDKNIKDHLMDIINLYTNLKDSVTGFRYSRIKTFFKYKTIDEAIDNLKAASCYRKESWNEDIEKALIDYLTDKYEKVKADAVYIERSCEAVSFRKQVCSNINPEA
ncbi:class I SAM-dependent methyltransferase [Candidatus Woesearchaeota archaeon]|nr:class I SAM-dependent methyltransferase [Candidatus Woesearchaeota archaeon]